ncbi:MAG: hypothetical protein IPM50_03585 [Acidobacteriota bacterium]|nr:MAG: hypothetical protein IPM50_03585 [Acidobacteriota bacterium]
MKRTFWTGLVISLFAFSAFAQDKADVENITPSPAALVAIWDINYTFDNTTTVTRQIRFIQYANGTGLFMPANALPTTTSNLRAGNRALWDMPQPFFLSFSGEVRLPVSNTTETGTLVFKAINGNTGLLHGRVVFVQNNAGPATTPTNLYSIRTGTFTAIQVPITTTTPTATDGEEIDQ